MVKIYRTSELLMPSEAEQFIDKDWTDVKDLGLLHEKLILTGLTPIQIRMVIELFQ